MTVPTWNAETFHRQRQPTERKHRLRIVAAAVAIVMAGAAAATATGSDEMIGVCHASEAGFVHILVDEDGYEHGHHRHHEGDFFTDTGDCDGDLPVEAPVENVTVEPLPEADVPQNATDNATVAPDDGNAVAAPNGTNATQLPPGDAWIRQTATQGDDHVVLTITFGNAGEGVAVDAVLHDRLPDVGRTWALSGDADCLLEDRLLTCWLGDLQPGESGTLRLSAFTDQMRCGDALTNTATIAIEDDAEPRNDAASASIHAQAC